MEIGYCDTELLCVLSFEQGLESQFFKHSAQVPALLSLPDRCLLWGLGHTWDGEGVVAVRTLPLDIPGVPD